VLELLDELDPDDDVDDEEEEPIFGQLCVLYDEPDPLDDDDVFVLVLDCANEANPITRAATITIAMIVTIARFRLLGKNTPVPEDCALIDNSLFLHLFFAYRQGKYLLS
jgi:hypothetical protein